MAKTDEDLRLERELFVRALMPAMRGDGAARLATLLTPREVPADTILYREGEPPDEFFFLVEGQVVMEADGIPTWTFGDRSLLGVMDMTAWRPHRRTCRTTRPTRLLAGHSAAWLDLLDDDPVMGEDAIFSFAQRLETSRLELGQLLAPEPIAPDPGVSAPLALYEKALALRDTPLLARASTQAIASLAQIADELTFDPGEEVFAFGHGERALFVVVRGVLELTLHVDGAQRVTRVGPACSLATSAALSGQLGQYSARAETAAIVLRIREEEYYDQSDEHPDLTRAAMAYMASELEKMLDLKPPTD
jgi:CRP-like cAMP-binding protein